MTDWNIQSRAHACTACGKSFVDKEVYHTLLFDARAELQRVDVCQACWVQQYSQGARERKGFISYWHGEYQAPVRTVDPIQKETAETLLRKLIERNQPHYIPAGFILAVMLERKRLLKVKEQFVRDGQRVLVYEQPKTGDIFTIIDPDLHLDQLEAVQKDVASLLEHGLPDEPCAVESQPAPAQSPENPAAELDRGQPVTAPAEPAGSQETLAEPGIAPHPTVPEENPR